MSTLLEQWRDTAYSKEMDKASLQKFWGTYFQTEKEIYEKLLENPDEEVKGMLSALQKCDDEVKAQAALPKNDDLFADCYISKQQLDASRGAWFRKNNWKLKIIMEQFGWTRKFLYHKILVELSDIYDLELEEKFYVQRFGYRPEYKLDLLDGSKSLARLATGYINYLLTEEGDY